jgi:hypothetical protein
MKLAENIKVLLRTEKEKCTEILAKIEKKILENDMQPEKAPIFIIGAPRSGTTVIYQTLTYGVSLAYFYNLLDKFSDFPGIMAKIINKMVNPIPPNCYKNYYGETSGWRGPSQGRQIWRRWFPEDQSYVGCGELSKKDKMQVRGTIALIENAYKLPFINKSQGNCERILALNEIFVEPIFIYVKRDNFQTIQSILNGRIEFMGSKEKWFSVKPSKYNYIKDHNPIRQICEQVYYIEEDIIRDLSVIGKDKTFEIKYENFCRNPREILKDFINFYSKKEGFKLARRKKIPKYFIASKGRTLSKEDSELIKKYISKIWTR